LDIGGKFQSWISWTVADALTKGSSDISKPPSRSICAQSLLVMYRANIHYQYRDTCTRVGAYPMLVDIKDKEPFDALNELVCSKPCSYPHFGMYEVL
jgi:hypothetical protein